MRKLKHFSASKKFTFLSAGVASILLLTAAAGSGSFFEVSKNLDIFTTLYKELNTYYVDTLNPDQLIQAGVGTMCESLDPYTDYIPEENIAEYRQMTTGRYGGIGALIGTRGEWVTITDPYEGCPSQKAGLLAGDKILLIDGKNSKNIVSDEISKRLKGKAGTTVVVRVARLDKDLKEKEIDISIVREEIKIKNVPFYGMISSDVGYIRLNGFTEKAGSEVHAAFNYLINKHKIKGIVLDLRGNPGGLLNEAVNVANVFVDKGIDVVSTKGRMEEQNKSYATFNEAVDTKLPMVVLADTNSASAAEIVTGTLQDLDRAVVIGQRTFGKGLVQSTHSLPYNAKLKLTTAKYYIPSGRCIQAINYADKAADGSVKRKADSLKVAFKTKGGRIVYDGVGIDPDIRIEPEKLSPVVIPLYLKNIFFDFATEYRAKHAHIASARDFRLTDKEYEEFMEYATKKDFKYTTQSEKLLEHLKTTATKENSFEKIKEEYEAIKNSLVKDKKQDLLKEKKMVKQILEEEISSRYYWQGGRLETTIRDDKEIDKALELLHDESKMKAILVKK